MKYRPDIDGLRAVAVLAVLFYHAGFDFFSGGFVGVDVFFVISGYLITKKISDEIIASEFSLIEFYEKRIRRIFPALFTTLFFTLIVGAWLYNTLTFKELGQSATATTLFASNIFFWTKAGYFDNPSALKPLLHMWSLSVEEQFYMVLPVLLILLFRFFKNHVRTILAVIAAISFITVIYTLDQDPSAAFYLTHGRVWELLMGSMLALSKIEKPKSGQRNLVSAAGIFMILASIVIYTDETPFPGVAALIPVLGSTMIIYSGIEGLPWISKILSTKPFVYFGKISYSLYLWHWPLLVFTKAYLIRELTTLDRLILLGMTIIISTLSWKLIETPFRNRTFLAKPRIFYLAAGVMALAGITGVIIHLTNGLPERFQPDQAIILDEKAWNGEREHWLECVNDDHSEPCPIGAKDQSPIFVLWGDSHAGAIAPAVNLSATNANTAGYLFWKAGCPTLLGIDRTAFRNQECATHNENVIDFLEDHPEINTVILNSRWAISANGTRYKQETGSPVILVDIENPENNEVGNELLFEIGIRRTIDELISQGREVILVSSIPEVGFPVPSVFFIAERTGRDTDSLIAPTLEEYQARNEFLVSVLLDLTDQYSQVHFIDPAEILCDSSICRVILESKPLYMDKTHMSTFGGYYIAEIFDPVFEDLKNR